MPHAINQQIAHVASHASYSNKVVLKHRSFNKKNWIGSKQRKQRKLYQVCSDDVKEYFCKDKVCLRKKLDAFSIIFWKSCNTADKELDNRAISKQ